MKRFQYLLAGVLLCCAIDACAIELVTEKLEEAFRRVGIPEHADLMPWARAYQSALSTPDFCMFSAGRAAEREALFHWVGPVAALDRVLYAHADYANKPAKLEDVRKEMLGGYLQDAISVWLAGSGYHVDTAPCGDYNPQKLLNVRFNFRASSRTRASALLAKQGLTDRIFPGLTFGHSDLNLACNPAVPMATVAKLKDALKQMVVDGA
jgi:polar amino acid transport system substrate-binding protein